MTESFKTLGDMLVSRYQQDFFYDVVLELGPWLIEECMFADVLFYGRPRKAVISHLCTKRKRRLPPGRRTCCLETVPREVIDTYRMLYLEEP
jgi:hypothetical protein